MTRVFTPTLLAGSAAYGIAAAAAFTLFFAPFAGAGKIVDAALSASLVLTPYALLYLAHRLSVDQASENVVAGMSSIAAAIGAFAYYFSFGPNDGEYALVYVLAPILQSPFVVVSLGVVLWRRRKGQPSAT